MSLNNIMNYRQQGSTTALINLMKDDPTVRMVVHTEQFARQLRHEHKFEEGRIFSLYVLDSTLVGTIGPIVFDIPAVITLARREYLKGLEEHMRGLEELSVALEREAK